MKTYPMIQWRTGRNRSSHTLLGHTGILTCYNVKLLDIAKFSGNEAKFNHAVALVSYAVTGMHTFLLKV